MTELKLAENTPQHSPSWTWGTCGTICDVNDYDKGQR